MTLPTVNLWGTEMVPLIGPGEGQVLPLVQSLNGSWDADSGYHDENTFTGAAIYLHSGRAYMQGRIFWIDFDNYADSDVLSDVLPARFRPLVDTDFDAYNDPGGTHEAELGRFFTIRVKTTGHIQIVGRLPHGEVSAALSLDNIGWDVVSGASDAPTNWLALPANAEAGVGSNNTYDLSAGEQAVHNNRVHLRGTWGADGNGGAIYGGFTGGPYGTPMPHPPTHWQDANRMVLPCSDGRRYAISVNHNHGLVNLEPSGPVGTAPVYQLANGLIYNGGWTNDLINDSTVPSAGTWNGFTVAARANVVQPASKVEYVTAEYIRIDRTAAVGSKGAFIVRRTGNDYYKVEVEVTVAASGLTPPVVEMNLFKVLSGVPTTVSPLLSTSLDVIDDATTHWRGSGQVQTSESGGNLLIDFTGGSAGFVHYTESLGTALPLGNTGYGTWFGIDWFSVYAAAAAADVYPPSAETLDLTGVGWIPDLGFMSVT
jgi:hypothetical protein